MDLFHVRYTEDGLFFYEKLVRADDKKEVLELLSKEKGIHIGWRWSCKMKRLPRKKRVMNLELIY